MIDYVIDYMERQGVIFRSTEELETATVGIRLYLLENGVAETDTTDYFRQYLDRSLSRIDRRDLKQFFLSYPVISGVQQTCIVFCAKGTIPKDRKAALLNDMTTLYKMGLGEKYIPAAKVNEILGEFLCR